MALTRFTAFADVAVPGVRALQPYLPGKPIAELERELGISGAIKLASNENPLGPSPRALAAVQDALPELARYPDGGGFALKAALATRLGVDANQITLGNGSNDVLEFAARAFVAPGDEVVFSAHAFAVYPIATQAVGGRAVVAQAREWGHDLDALRSAVSERTRLVFIANPNNPTGTWLNGSDLEAFIASLPEHLPVVVDEAYHEYAADPDFGITGYTSLLDRIARYPNLIIARTFSKAYGLAGLRAGYAVSHPHVADLLNRVRQPFNVNSLALIAAEAALADGAHLQRGLELNRVGMRQLRAGFDALGLAYIPSAGNFISVEVGRQAASVYQALLREGVIVRPVANYGMPRHLRVTIGLPEENARLLAALRKVL